MILKFTNGAARFLLKIDNLQAGQEETAGKKGRIGDFGTWLREKESGDGGKN